MIRGSFFDLMDSLKYSRKVLTEETQRRTGINDFMHFVGEDSNMGQRQGYSQLQNLMNQQQQNALANQGLLGQLGGLGIAQQDLKMGQLVAANQIGSIYPGQIFQHQDLNAYDYRTKQMAPISEIAKEYGFEYDFDTGGWKSKYDGFVSRMDVEGVRLDKVKEVFQKRKCPNQHWLDTRVEEMRVRLC